MDFTDLAGLTFSEVDQQPYRDCVFSAGILHGHPVDTIYLRLVRADAEPTTIILRRDEAVRIAGLLCNAVWSEMLYPARVAEDALEFTNCG